MRDRAIRLDGDDLDRTMGGPVVRRRRGTPSYVDAVAVQEAPCIPP